MDEKATGNLADETQSGRIVVVANTLAEERKESGSPTDA
jgi:hypothetical protein